MDQEYKTAFSEFNNTTKDFLSFLSEINELDESDPAVAQIQNSLVEKENFINDSNLTENSFVSEVSNTVDLQHSKTEVSVFSVVSAAQLSAQPGLTVTTLPEIKIQSSSPKSDRSCITMNKPKLLPKPSKKPKLPPKPSKKVVSAQAK